MRALVLSDTHLGPETLDRMPPEVWSMAVEADVVLHAGDVVHPSVLAALRDHAPVHAVLGNNDHALAGMLPEVLELQLDGASVAMIHDGGPTQGRAGRMARRFPDAEVIVFGHSHEPTAELLGGPLLLNPGSPTQRRRQPVHTVAWLELSVGQVRAEVVPVGPLAASTVRSTAS